jgi:hypothetical protein
MNVMFYRKQLSSRIYSVRSITEFRVAVTDQVASDTKDETREKEES